MNYGRSALLALIYGCFLVPAVAADNILHRGSALEPESLDPQIVKSLEAGAIVRDLYEGLVREGPAGELLPGVAASWSMSDDGLEYTFQLRPDARWCDGSPVTAEDIVAGYRRNFDYALGAVNPDRWKFLLNAQAIMAGEAAVERLGVEAAGERVVRIKLEHPVPYLLHLAHHTSAYPYRERTAPSTGCPTGVVSNGAYALERHSVNDRTDMVKNSEYWDANNVAIERVAYHVITDSHAELSRFRAGGLHITATIPPARVDWARNALPGEVRVSPMMATYFFGINLRRAPLGTDAKIRRALSLAIDRELIVQQVTKGGELPASSWVPPGMGPYAPQVPSEHRLPYTQRVALAKQLLNEAGVEGGSLDAILSYNEGEVHERIATTVQSLWKHSLGVHARLEKLEWKVLLSKRGAGDIAMFRGGWSSDYPDALGFATLPMSGNPGNHFKYESDEYDALVVEASGENDEARRVDLLEQAERVLLADQPLIPVYYYTSKHLVSKKLGGWENNNSDHHLSRYLYFR